MLPILDTVGCRDADASKNVFKAMNGGSTFKLWFPFDLLNRKNWSVLKPRIEQPVTGFIYRHD